MGAFTRISWAEAAYVSDGRVSYRLLAVTPDNCCWIIVPNVSEPQPSYYVTCPDGSFTYEVRRGTPGSAYGGDGELVGYAQNLMDATWPVEDDLIKRGVDLGT